MAVETTTAQVMDKINLSQLLPEWGAIFNGFPQTGTELSAWFVVSLLALTIFFLGFSLLKVGQARQRINWLGDLLKDQTSESIADNRLTLVEKAQNIKHEAGHLWLEFDETLVETDQSGKVKLHNTYDAAYFFNTSTLAAGITESRLLAAVPGFLTALGVIGTFIGLQLGMAQLNIAGDVSIEEMKTGVAGVINGAKFAFMTSVWGVALSVLFNVIEKSIERIARRKVADLQERIDTLFSRISAEGQLQRIANDSEQSRESLQGLAEKIGEKMQESLLEATAGIQTGLEASLEKIMAPAINKLVDETSDGNQKALEGLLEKFMDKFGSEGEKQRQGMDEASERMNASLAAFGTSMQAFLNKMEASQNDTAKREEELVQKISGQVDYLVENTNTQSKALTEFVQSTLGDLSEDLNERDQQATDREIHRGDEFIKQTEAMKTGTAELLNRIDEGLKTQFNATHELLTQGENLQTSVESSVKSSAEASDSMKRTSAELNHAASSMSVFGSNIKVAGDQLSGAVTNAVKSTQLLAQQNQRSSQQMEELRTQLVQNTSEFQKTITQMQGILELADDAFESMGDHQQNYLNGLKQNVEELAVKMTSLLEDYATQANGQTAQHLKVWAEGTTQYAVQMNNAAQSLSGVIDDIEDKLVRKS